VIVDNQLPAAGLRLLVRDGLCKLPEGVKTLRPPLAINPNIPFLEGF